MAINGVGTEILASSLFKVGDYLCPAYHIYCAKTALCRQKAEAVLSHRDRARGVIHASTLRDILVDCYLKR